MDEFDSLNTLSTEKFRSIPFEKYFGDMDLTDEQKEERIKLAEDLKVVILFLFSLIYLYKEYATSSRTDIMLYLETITLQFKNRYRKVLEQNVELDEYVEDYINLFAAMVLETTLRHADEEYYLSEDRSTYIAENEANTVLNHIDYQRAIESSKTKKKWIDMRDNRERKTHLMVGRTVKPIKEPFVVGNSLMLFPKDDSLGADDSEIVNCRCSIKYF